MLKTIKQYLCIKKKHIKNNKISYTIINDIQITEGYIVGNQYMQFVKCDYCGDQYAIYVMNDGKKMAMIRNKRAEKKHNLCSAFTNWEWFLALTMEQQNIIKSWLDQLPIEWRPRTE